MLVNDTNFYKNKKLTYELCLHIIDRARYIPPLDIHVTLIVAPSLYGPNILSIISAPWLSRIVNFVGGTGIKDKHE